jgi:hypothetical protein
MLARRLTTILPAMSLADALETTRLHRVAGLTGARTAVVTTRPFRALPHPITAVGLNRGRDRCCHLGVWQGASWLADCAAWVGANRPDGMLSSRLR